LIDDFKQQLFKNLGQVLENLEVLDQFLETDCNLGTVLDQPSKSDLKTLKETNLTLKTTLKHNNKDQERKYQLKFGRNEKKQN
jgi:hypothetical protein